MVSTVANPAHLLWQERVDKERQLAKRQIIRQLGLRDSCTSAADAPPLHDLHQCMSMQGGAGMLLPKIPSTPPVRPLSTAKSTPSLRSAKQLQSSGSLRSSLTGLTSASLRREVHEAVAAEVARIVEPLKEKLHTEKTARQRLENMLRVAKGGPAEADR
ncbi:unnamed protein product [Effrenium voratum]|uniref:Uncharacterized protein n=1 Tax=Effrenium voratum TaxID=2562239 RepID=A0AA36I2J4_9DINO|nr:unnamed protein product [Effrenium voratum]